MQRDKQRTLAMETLSDDDEIVGVEHFTGTNDGVEGAETGVVQHDIAQGNAAGNQVSDAWSSVRCSFAGVITAEQQIFHFAAVISV